MSRRRSQALVATSVRSLSSWAPSCDLLPPPHATHTVLNQSRPWEGNVYLEDLAIREAVQQHHGSWSDEHLSSYGEWCGSAAALDLAKDANERIPVLQQFDRFGKRVDRVHCVCKRPLPVFVEWLR